MSLAERLFKLNSLRKKVKETEELTANAEKLRRENEQIAGRLLLENSLIKKDLHHERCANERFKNVTDELMKQKNDLENKLNGILQRLQSEKERGIIPIRQNRLRAEAEIWELKKSIQDVVEKLNAAENKRKE